ncbi:MAG: aryl-sulfate sulfotransferase [Gelidibacter sp.]
MNKELLKLSKICIFLLSSLVSEAQSPTIGLQFNDPNAFDGYTLFTPSSNNKVYLIDNCGQKINEWTFTELPALTCYLLENGNLLRAGKESIEIRDWDNNVVWSFLLSNLGLNQHHDIEPLPNGNVLCIITDRYTPTEMIALGRDPSTVNAQFKLDKIVELQPVGTNGATMVWEWKFIDHFIQDFDNTKPNFGVIENHPELIDINYDNGYSDDWTHVNAIDYNANLDQIMLSVRHLNEIIIIDHSTTTLEAIGHTGGNSNRGGDLLWRWGNPQVYGQGTASDQKLFLQHDPKWVENGYLDEGKITVFNNGGDGTDSFSSIHIIAPEIINGAYAMENNKFKPLDFEWSWNGTILGDVMKEDIKSGTHSLPNGNLIVCETFRARISEITKSGTLLWSYKNPSSDIIYDQFQVPPGRDLFRGEKYPTDYPGFVGKDLTPQGLIENENSLSDVCIANLGIEDLQEQALMVINPINNNTIRFNKVINTNKLVIMDINGKIVCQLDDFTGNEIHVPLPSALYFLRIYNDNGTLTRRLIVK